MQGVLFYVALPPEYVPYVYQYTLYIRRYYCRRVGGTVDK